MPVSFDGPNLTITLDSLDPQVEVSGDLYSEWKEWMLLSDHIKYPPAFRTIGGDPLTAVLSAGAYFFLRNDLGWRIRPGEADQTYLFTGNLAAENPSLPILVPTIGNFRVLVIGIQPVTQIVTSSEVVNPLDEVVESTYTMRQILRLLAAASAGDVAFTAGDTVATLKGVDEVTNRIVATVDATGNRNVTARNVG